jgi:hypothetical protein
MTSSQTIRNTLLNTVPLSIQDFQQDGTLVHPSVNKAVCFVLFYLPYCRFCQDFSVPFTIFGQNHASHVKLGAVDVTSQSNLGIMTYLRSAPYALNAFPTVIVYYNGYPCSVYQRGAVGTDEVSQLTSALRATARGCGGCTLSSCRL